MGEQDSLKLAAVELLACRNNLKVAAHVRYACRRNAAAFVRRTHLVRARSPGCKSHPASAGSASGHRCCRRLEAPLCLLTAQATAGEHLTRPPATSWRHVGQRGKHNCFDKELFRATLYPLTLHSLSVTLKEAGEAYARRCSDQCWGGVSGVAAADCLSSANVGRCTSAA